MAGIYCAMIPGFESDPMNSESAHIRRFSELARRVIHLAEVTAQQFDHPGVGVGHLALALALEERSSTALLLRQSGLDAEGLWRALSRGDAALLMSIEPALDAAVEWAQYMGSHYTGTEHLLLALTASGEHQPILSQHRADVVLLYERLTVALR